ncbi:MAG: Translation initiation factor RLI1 containing Fe-S and AAA+ ATPase domain [Candidatus Methanohalarchaeum thermophilum]|uniref:Translation initiation factor RLI1 containing Fe-S and AAA+ ATPase domain n=1 Tax=Methanohalarchaeum thermophilum TaxID=1903181 RepID=A0A1Q6DWY8_METT1|nr:MAG: Translation initiation factor RLI1 containing Fe-S and AAA+ ATPase domain [Candidatus Methanohalarchaeum thermophilum]
MRIAVLDEEKCQPKKCSKECYNFCPRVRSGDETIKFERGRDKPIINEELCSGCNICVRKCPFDAIKIINLPEELEENPVHRYGKNGFALYKLPIPIEESVTGILGSNGIGKTTAVNILAGELKPNLGREEEPSWEEIIDRFSGSVLQRHFKKIHKDEIDVSYKPQYINHLPSVHEGEVNDLLESVDERNELDNITEFLGLRGILNRDIDVLSGGELQRVAIAACLSREADLYFLDEVTPYLDIYQRKRVAKLVKEISEEKTILVVEHDLAILDLISENIHLAYGEPGGYGVLTKPKGTRRGINQYLEGFLPEENIRIRKDKIGFKNSTVINKEFGKTLGEYSSFEKRYEDFVLNVESGKLYEGETIGIVGPNAIGKSTMVKVFAGKSKPTSGKINLDLDISYKPQYIEADFEGKVETFLSTITDKFGSSYYKTRILKPLSLSNILGQKITDLSGGELQRVAIAACLSREADLYILDEPSAHLDVEQRALATKTIKRETSQANKTAMVVDHDIYMIDLLSDRLLVFEGEPGKKGKAKGPFKMKKGMNIFLRDLDITFRRDEDTNRPRINKAGSNLDRKQKKTNNYYYT